MADGKVEIGVELNGKQAQSQASKLGKDLESSIKSGTKGVDSALDGVSSKFSKAFSHGADNAKSAMGQVGSAAHSMGGSVGSASDGIISKLGGIATAAVAVVGGMEAIGKAADFVMDAVNAYASYEQLVGGVETLFGAGGAKNVEEYAKSVGKSVDEVQGKYQELTTAESMVFDNAKKAYREAGVSANTYMEQATSFSASLVSSLGGDTVKAAEYANTAIVDMSDNANKMGTSIDMIQNAYQGFAKQNYTMLDNLKLGYGGTKSEMERLISDANELAAANGQAADLTIDSYADVIEAIHLVQENMGITGTTQKEATETIEGSLNMAKAAYEDFMVSLADKNGNIAQTLTNLVESVGTVAENIIPAITETVASIKRVLGNSFGDVISGLSSKIMPMITELIGVIISAIPDLISAGVQLIGAIATGFIQGIPDMLFIIAEGFMEGVPGIVEALTSVFMQLVEAIPEMLNGLVEYMPTIIDMLVSGLMQSVGALIEGFVQLFNAVVAAFPQIITALVAMIPAIVNGLVQTLIANMPVLVQGFITLFMAIVQAVPQIISAIVAVLPQIITAIVTTLVSLAPQLLTVAIAMFAQFVLGIVQAIPQVIGALVDMGAQMIASIGELPGKMLEIGANIIQGIWEGISGAIGGLISNIGSACSDILGSITGFFGIHSPSTLMRDVVGKNLAEGIAVGFKDNDPFDSIEDALSDGVESLETAADGLQADIPVDVEAVGDTAALTVDSYTDSIEDQALAANESGEHMASEVTDGMGDGVSVADDIGGNTADAYISEINRADAGPAAGSLKDSAVQELDKGKDDAYSAGANLGQGFIDGMDSTMSGVIAKATELARAAIDAIATEGQQGSPWKTTIRCGEFAGEGLAVGFERSNPMAQIAASIRDGLNTISLMTQAASAGGNMNDNRQYINFNQPVTTPDQIARTMRMQQHYGLAGEY